MSILNRLSEIYTIEAKDRPATAEEIEQLKKNSPVSLPSDYIKLLKEATDVEMTIQNGKLIRIWGITGMNGVIELNAAYEVQQNIPDSLVIGDDGGDMALLFFNGSDGFGLYLTGFGDLDEETAIKISPTLSDFFINKVGVENFLW
ncbi:SMI1/KNR4 family protein [Chengkuizengella sp. SCS-71B]|uniref:SMI1/KNR4 family protein n=1 Tax=Chengkuizengella sp. SCS-71B TaxID=3115290 RepID=UPI0032C232A6